MSYRKTDENGKYIKFNFCCKLSEFNFGAGLQLYFHFLKYFAILMLILSLLSGMGYATLYNHKGLVNSGDLNRDGLDSEFNKLYYGLSMGNIDNTYTERDILIIKYMDILCVVIFLIGSWHYKMSSASKAEKIDEDTYTAADYAVYIHGFPSKGVSEKEIFDHFA